MFELLYSKYWQFGFKTRLYDALAPEAYLRSLHRAADLLDIDNKGILLDAGCGSGLLLQFVKDKLRAGMAYAGTDFLFAGLSALKGKASSLSENSSVFCFQADLTEGLPLPANSVDAAVAHFSIYAVGNKNQRVNALKNLRSVLKSGGTLVIVNPSRNYNPKRIIQESAANLKGVRGIIAKFLLYPLTLNFGLKYIDSQLKLDNWHAYTEEEFCGEIREGGFDVLQVESIYADSAYLALCKAPQLDEAER